MEHLQILRIGLEAMDRRGAPASHHERPEQTDVAPQVQHGWAACRIQERCQDGRRLVAARLLAVPEYLFEDVQVPRAVSQEDPQARGPQAMAGRPGRVRPGKELERHEADRPVNRSGIPRRAAQTPHRSRDEQRLCPRNPPAHPSETVGHGRGSSRPARKAGGARRPGGPARPSAGPARLDGDLLVHLDRFGDSRRLGLWGQARPAASAEEAGEEAAAGRPLGRPRGLRPGRRGRFEA